jgi:hypothetical protein
MISLKLLSAINIATDDSELLDRIDILSGYLEDGTLAATVDGDAITALRLTDAGRAALKPLPWSAA